jgi:predicted alpha/beta superfamily hydrolase
MSTNDQNAILNSEVHFLTSAAADTEYKILIGKVGFTEGVAPVVLYLPDADFFFGGVMNMLVSMRWVGYVPPMIVVGIGYRVQDEIETFSPRSRDMTICDDVAMAERGWTTGGASRFLQFIRDELKPWVAERFEVDPDNDAYYGFSFGGLFGTYVLLTQPDTFKRYGIASPSLWYGTQTMFELEETYAASHDDLEAKVYFSVGGLETPTGDHIHLQWLPEDKRAEAEAEEAAAFERHGVINMVADMQRLAAALAKRGYPGFTFDSEVLADQFHVTAGLPCFSRSMRFLFDAPLKS